MTRLAVVDNPFDFTSMHTAIQKYVDDNLLAGASAVVLKDNKIVDFKTWGYSDMESSTPVTEDTIFRIYSNTKIITSVAAMCLHEDGKFKLEDTIDKYLPELSNLKVLKAGSTDPAETEELKTRPTIRQLVSHHAGFSYGIFAESPVDALYMENNVLNPGGTLEDLVTKVAAIPLAYQPGARWQYSVSTDILARLVEVWSGMSFLDFLKLRIFSPLGMDDTDFHVAIEKHSRLATNSVPGYGTGNHEGWYRDAASGQGISLALIRLPAARRKSFFAGRLCPTIGSVHRPASAAPRPSQAG